MSLKVNQKAMEAKKIFINFQNECANVKLRIRNAERFLSCARFRWSGFSHSNGYFAIRGMAKDRSQRRLLCFSWNGKDLVKATATLSFE